MKKSFIILVNDLTKKIIIFLFCVLGITILCTSGLIGGMFRAMAYDSVFINDESKLKNMMSFEISEIIPHLTNSTYNAYDSKTLPQTVSTEVKKEEEKSVNEPANVDFSKEKSTISVSAKDIIVSNAAKKSFDIPTLLSMPLSYTKTQGYKVLIIHTHTTESYLPDDRCEDQNKNIVRVGEEFERVLNENNIKTLHVKTVHDVPYSKSYINQLKTIEQTLKEHPSIEVIIDVHRDALYNSKQEKLKPVTKIGNEKTAQVMLVCGTNAMGLQHDYWKNCFSFALKIQENMNKNYPNLARPINLREERFNTHMTKNSVIFEIGANGNTLEEAIRAGGYAAQCIANVINGKNLKK